MSLENIREQLDLIDSQIVDLFQERMKLCEDVGHDKIKTGKKVYDKQRELDKLSVLSDKASNDFNKRSIHELFEHIIAISRKRQYQILEEHGVYGNASFIQLEQLHTENARFVFQGIEGAYSQAALHQYFGNTQNVLHVDTFRDAMEKIEEGSADFAVLPIENSSADAVNQVYDLLVEFENYIVCEKHIHATQFIIVTNQKVFLKNANKISICLEVPHESGSLYHILSHFIYNNLNMTKIESRPIEGRTWEYRFFIDFEGNMANSAVKNAIRGLREEARNLKILGNY